MLAQPADEVEDVGVPPHPGRETLEAGKRVRGLGVLAGAAHEAVDPERVGPVGLDGDGVESLLANEAFRQDGALPVELVRAVRGLADQDEARAADPVEERVVVRGRSRQREHGVANGGIGPPGGP